MRKSFAVILPALLALPLSTALALENPVGAPQLLNGMEVAAVYLQPIEMDPPDMMAPADKSDIHLEADIHATADNANGYAEGDWLPGMAVSYRLEKQGTGTIATGEMMPMVASDGPHYGDNVKLSGAGRYRLVLTIAPGGDGHGFGRHVDKETGVAPFAAPFDVTFDFVYAGTGKKGGY